MYAQKGVVMVQVIGVSLNQFYRLDLKDMRSAGPNVAHQVQWNAQTGHKMKMRQFFANAQWAQQIHSVDISSSGAKGGVVFLYKKKANSQEAEDTPAYVVKYTVAPERMIFAEYLLKTIAGAKLPRSLPVYLDWADANCPGMELLTLLRNQDNWRFKANPTRGFALNQAKKNKYEQVFLQAIDDDHLANSYSYLVIMKAFTGVHSLIDAAPFDEWLIAAGYKQPQVVVGVPDLASVTTTWQQIQQDGKLRDNILVAKLYDLFEKCNWTKRILANPHWAQYLGWILAADILAGNADRIEELNVGNLFFFDKPTPDPNTKHPIAVIDNDALMPVFSHDLHNTIKANMTPGTPATDRYLVWALVQGTIGPPLKPKAYIYRLRPVF
jgi:hypothetical protein